LGLYWHGLPTAWNFDSAVDFGTGLEHWADTFFAYGKMTVAADKRQQQL